MVLCIFLIIAAAMRTHEQNTELGALTGCSKLEQMAQPDSYMYETKQISFQPPTTMSQTHSRRLPSNFARGIRSIRVCHSSVRILAHQV